MYVEAAEAHNALTHSDAREDLHMGGVGFPQFDPPSGEGLAAVLNEDDGLPAGLDHGLPGHHQARCGVSNTQGEFQQIADDETDIARHEDGHRRREGVLVEDEALRQECATCCKQIARPRPIPSFRRDRDNRMEGTADAVVHMTFDQNGVVYGDSDQRTTGGDRFTVARTHLDKNPT